MRCLLEVWESTVSLGETGADIRAVTAWALLGSYDWNSMLTRFEGHYESGIFDVRGGKPRPTALAAQMTAMAQGKRPDHGEQGLLHLANRGTVTWLQLARMAAERAGLDLQRARGRSRHSLKMSDPLLCRRVLGSEHGQFLQSLEAALDCYFTVIREIGRAHV